MTLAARPRSAGHISRPGDQHVGSVKLDQPASFDSRILSGRLIKQLQLAGQHRLQEDLTGLQSRNTLLNLNCHIQAYEKY